jgi:hypothetical protein
MCCDGGTLDGRKEGEKRKGVILHGYSHFLFLFFSFFPPFPFLFPS